MTPSTIALGAPFLVSDAYGTKNGRPVKFLVTVNGKTTESAPAKNTDGSVYLKFDLAGLPDGTYTASVRAVDHKGVESAPATYSFKKTGAEAVPYAPPAPKQKIGPSHSYRGHIEK